MGSASNIYRFSVDKLFSGRPQQSAVFSFKAEWDFMKTAADTRGEYLPMQLTLDTDQDWTWMQGENMPSIQAAREVRTTADGSVWPRQTAVHLCGCQAAGGSMNLN